MPDHHRVVREQRDEGEEAEQSGRRVGDGARRPLPLGLNAQVSAGSMAGSVQDHFHLPTPDEPGEDLMRRCREIGAESSACVANFPCGSRMSTDEYPADGDRWQAGVIPDGRLRDDFDNALRLAIPARDHERSPLVERAAVNCVWTHDRWYLTSHLLRTMLMQTLTVFTNRSPARPHLQLADLAASTDVHRESR